MKYLIIAFLFPAFGMNAQTLLSDTSFVQGKYMTNVKKYEDGSIITSQVVVDSVKNEMHQDFRNNLESELRGMVANINIVIEFEKRIRALQRKNADIVAITGVNVLNKIEDTIKDLFVGSYELTNLSSVTPLDVTLNASGRLVYKLGTATRKAVTALSEDIIVLQQFSDTKDLVLYKVKEGVWATPGGNIKIVKK